MFTFTDSYSITMSQPTVQIRDHILETHFDTLSAIIEAGSEVESFWESKTVNKGTAVSGPLKLVLKDRNLVEPLHQILASSTESLEAELVKNTVQDPPYLNITSRGPVLRAPLSTGNRLVITIVLFGVSRSPPRYRFLNPDPSEALDVQFRTLY